MSNDRIAQRDLREVLMRKNELYLKRKELKRLESEYKEHQRDIIERLLNGAPVREGRLSASAKSSSRSNNLSYERLENLVGSDLAETIKDAMGSTPKTVLEIQENDD